jgi:hypothetical protein
VGYGFGVFLTYPADVVSTAIPSISQVCVRAAHHKTALTSASGILHAGQLLGIHFVGGGIKMQRGAARTRYAVSWLDSRSGVVVFFR